ncbi:MAG: hypothetical protein NVSMB52_16610 [Chloroflexota bacterium]
MAAPISSASVPSLSLPTSFRLTDRTLLCVVIGIVAVVGWSSFSSLLPLASGDTPRAFVPLVPLIAVALMIWRFDPVVLNKMEHDTFVDGIFATLLFLFAVVVLLLLPIVMSWDYWLDRLDIPGLVVLFAAILVTIWGLPALIRLGPVLLYLLLAWPLPLLLVSSHVLPVVTSATAYVAGGVLPWLPFGIHSNPLNHFELMIPFKGHTSYLLIAQACAGVNSAVGLVVIALPLAFMGKGKWEARVGWLLLGAFLSWFVNLVRICLLAAASALWGSGVTLTFLHPVVGLLLFALSFLLLLMLAPRIGLQLPFAVRRSQSERTTKSQRKQIGVKKLVFLAAIIAGTVAAEGALSQFSWISESGLPRIGLAEAGSLVHVPREWKITRAQPVTSWKSLFGDSSVASVVNMQGPMHSRITIQAILTRDVNTFRTYGVENCYVFHGYTLKSVHRIFLGNGITGALVDFASNGQSIASLYWLQPVQTPQGMYHERIVLLANTQHTNGTVVAVASQQATGSPAQGIAKTVTEFLSPWVGGKSGPSFDAVNAELQNLGRSMITQEKLASR